jgi:hypothetical protein
MIKIKPFPSSRLPVDFLGHPAWVRTERTETR